MRLFMSVGTTLRHDNRLLFWLLLAQVYNATRYNQCGNIMHATLMLFNQHITGSHNLQTLVIIPTIYTQALHIRKIQFWIHVFLSIGINKLIYITIPRWACYKLVILFRLYEEGDWIIEKMFVSMKTLNP